MLPLSAPTRQPNQLAIGSKPDMFFLLGELNPFLLSHRSPSDPKLMGFCHARSVE